MCRALSNVESTHPNPQCGRTIAPPIGDSVCHFNPCRPGGDSGGVGGEIISEREATISTPLHLSLCSNIFLLKPVVN